MKTEIAALRGRIAVNEGFLDTLKTGINTDIEDARIRLDTFTPISDLDEKRIAIIVARLCKSITQFKELSTQTNQMKKDLGVE